MKVRFDEKDDVYCVEGNPEAPRFNQICGGIGWLDEKGRDKAAFHWFVVLGETEDKRLLFLEEDIGPMSKIKAKAVDAKDRLMIRRIYLDDRPELLVRDLRDHDGLTRYLHSGRDALKRIQYLNKPEHWPHYRDRETVATLIPVPEDQLLDIQAGIERLDGDIRAKRTTIHHSCRHLQAAWRLPPKDALTHPGILAAVWAHNAMRRRQEVKKDVKAVPLYGNIRR